MAAVRLMRHTILTRFVWGFEAVGVLSVRGSLECSPPFMSIHVFFLEAMPYVNMLYYDCVNAFCINIPVCLSKYYV